MWQLVVSRPLTEIKTLVKSDLLKIVTHSFEVLYQQVFKY